MEVAPAADDQLAFDALMRELSQDASASLPGRSVAELVAGLPHQQALRLRQVDEELGCTFARQDPIFGCVPYEDISAMLRAIVGSPQLISLQAVRSQSVRLSSVE